jgi:hypothetical protein
MEIINMGGQISVADFGHFSAGDYNLVPQLHMPSIYQVLAITLVQVSGNMLVLKPTHNICGVFYWF